MSKTLLLENYIYFEHLNDVCQYICQIYIYIYKSIYS